MTKAEFNDKLKVFLYGEEKIPCGEIDEIFSRVDDENGISAKKLLLESGKMTEMEYAHAYACTTKTTCCDLKTIKVDEKVLSLIPAETAMKYCVFPLGISETDEGELLVVTDEPETPGLAEELKRVTGKEIKLIIGVRDDIADRIKQYYI
ncbi:MAG: hypothetical protein K5871_11930 [Lachnospiraceae bacterium]|nr:hypothetical protein [Lachnospiraceae bacterium]